MLDVVDGIPAGRVLTYGDVAAAIGSRAPRAVGQVMARHGEDVAWWRVVRASGEPAACHGDQAVDLLRAEGTPLREHASGGWRVRLDLARHDPAGAGHPRGAGDSGTPHDPS